MVALSIWWRKLSPDGNNANIVTGQGLTDLGRAATFYDCLVEVERADQAVLRTSPTITPKISSAPSGRITG